MPQSLVKNYVHLVFSTKHRQPFITKDIQVRFYAYIASICNHYECYPLAIGGVEDHVHILCSLSRTLSLSKLLEVVKANSSRWIKAQGKQYQNFWWQTGYAAFSVNPKQISSVKRYIDNQENHHQNQSFQNELRSMFGEYKVVYDERYVWG